MESRIFTQRLYTQLEAKDRLKLLERLVNLNDQHNQIEGEKKAAVDNFNGQKKTVEEAAQGIYREVRRNETLAEVECEEWIDKRETPEGTALQVITRRLDTGQIVDVRPISKAEVQKDLIFDEDQKEEWIESETERKDDVLIEWLNNEEFQAKIERLLPNEEVESWTPQDYSIVESWVLLTIYAAANPDKDVAVGDVPAILTNPIEHPETPETGAAEKTPDIELEFFVIEADGGTFAVHVPKEQVPQKYKAVSFNRETGEFTFWKDKGKKKLILTVECLVMPSPESEDFSDEIQPDSAYVESEGELEETEETDD